MDATQKINNPQSARDMADYHEAQARALRDHAAMLEKTHTHEVRRLIDVFRSGKLAAAFIHNGMSKKMAINTTARRLDLKTETVATHYERFKQRQREKLDDAIREKRAAGLSVRAIAKETGRPKSTIHDLLKL
jgi:DNA-directed RNA polymerase specialized sigma24 family protein